MKILFKITTLLLFSLTGFAQRSDGLRGQIFSFSPASYKVEKVNGMALGIGHFWTKNMPCKINGLNIEVNPVSPILFLFQDPDYVENDSLRMTMNGLHLSTGGFAGGIKLNGAGVSLYNVNYATNGFTVNGLYNVSKTLNGLHISGLYNVADKARGMLVAGANDVADFGGFRIGIYNKSVTTAGLNIGVVNLNKEGMHGLQIGVFNRTGKCKGLQIGLWNSNNKRSLPFINWNFKD